MMTNKTSSKKIVPKHMSQAEEPYDSDKSSFSTSKPWGADKTTKKTASKKRVSKPYDSDESSVSASKPAGADKTTKKTASKKRVSKEAAIQLEEPSDSEESSSSASSEDDNHDNVDVSDLEMVGVAFMTDVPDNEVTQRQRLAFNVPAFGYNCISDIFPTPPKSSTQFTDEKFSETLDIMRQIQSNDVDAKKKVLKTSKLNYKKAHQFELQEIHVQFRILCAATRHHTFRNWRLSKKTLAAAPDPPRGCFASSLFFLCSFPLLKRKRKLYPWSFGTKA
jgi:hypothetical protein